MSQDQVFKEEIKNASDFKFGTTVANVFDDMVNRSVPYYGEMQRMIAELAADQAKEGSYVYDLGCSTGTTMIGMNTLVPENIEFIGVDDSAEMLAKCDTKLKEAGFKRKYQLVNADLNKSVEIKNASVVVLCLTLQFVRPIHRERLVKTIYDGLNKDGVLILIEKILAEESSFNRDFIKYYYDMKRRHNYSEMEISQKREALENVLIPYKLSEDNLLLRESGFAHVEIFFKWYNFAGLIAVKNNMVSIGNFFFKYRNWLFIIFYALLFVPHVPQLFTAKNFGENYYWYPIIIGLIITILGQAIRGATIGLAYIIRGGKDKKVYAEDLVTTGIFAHCRNPLYVGNILMLAGVGVLSNSLLYVVIMIPFFLFVYQAIVLAEENFLRNKFDEQFNNYCARVNRWFPNVKGISKTFSGMRFNWKRYIAKEHTTTFIWLCGIVLLLLFYYPQLTDYDVHLRNTLLIIILSFLVLIYILIRVVKKSGRLND